MSDNVPLFSQLKKQDYIILACLAINAGGRTDSKDVVKNAVLQARNLEQHGEAPWQTEEEQDHSRKNTQKYHRNGNRGHYSRNNGERD